MKLHSKEFERSLRRGVRTSIRASAPLKREFRAANKFRRRHYSAGILVVPGMALIAGFFVSRAAELTGHPRTGLAVISVLAFASVFSHVRSLLMFLYRSTDLGALYLLPLTDDTVFQWELRKFIRRSLLTLAGVVIAFGALAFSLEFSFWQWLALLPIAVLTWLMIVALALLGITRLPRLPYPMVSTWIFLAGVLIFISIKFVGAPVFLAALDRCAPALNLLLPVGWPASLFELLLPDPPWPLGLLLFPTVAVIWTIPSSLRRLRARYHFREVILREPMDLPLPNALPHADAAPPQPSTRRAGLTEIEEMISSRLFLAPPSWPQIGWFEKRLWRWFTPREKALSEFIFPNGVAITAAWKKSLRFLGMMLLVAYAAGFVLPSLQVTILSIVIFSAGVTSLGLVSNSGRVFQSFLVSGVRIPFYAGFAMSLPEISTLLFKYSAVQIPVLLVLGSVCGGIVSVLGGFPGLDCVIYGLKAAILLFASRFIFIVFSFSSGTNDTDQLRLRSLALIFAFLVQGILFLGLAAAGLFVPEPSLAWLFTGLAVLDAYFLFRVYAWFYNSNRFDLLKMPRR